MEKIKITIAGVPHTIATDKDSEYTLGLSLEIEGKINKIMERSKIAPGQAAALALLEYADEVKKLREENENMKTQLGEYLADAAQAKSERDMLKREMAKIKKNSGEF